MFSATLAPGVFMKGLLLFVRVCRAQAPCKPDRSTGWGRNCRGPRRSRLALTPALSHAQVTRKRLALTPALSHKWERRRSYFLAAFLAGFSAPLASAFAALPLSALASTFAPLALSSFSACL